MVEGKANCQHIKKFLSYEFMHLEAFKYICMHSFLEKAY